MKKLPEELDHAPPYCACAWKFYCDVCGTCLEEFLGDLTMAELLELYQAEYECSHEESVAVLRKAQMAAAEAGLKEILGKRK